MNQMQFSFIAGSIQAIAGHALPMPALSFHFLYCHPLAGV
jgi:hypothetical protein